jgi:hypothetical protein
MATLSLSPKSRLNLFTLLLVALAVYTANAKISDLKNIFFEK